MDEGVVTAPVTAKVSTDMYSALRTKVRLLVDGLRINDALYQNAGDHKGRVEAIYGHHKGAPPPRVVPQEIVLHRPEGLRPTEAILAQVRFSQSSPNVLSWQDGQPVVCVDDVPIAVELIPKPAFYQLEAAPGVATSSVTQLLGLDLLGIVPSNYCALFSTHEECTFCEIIPHYAQARAYKLSVKPDELQVRALNQALAHDHVEYMVFTTGNYDLRNESTVDHYENVRSQLRVPGHVRRSYACLMPPDDVTALERLHAAGFTSVLLDIEVWDPDHYAGIVPGKARWLGHDGFLRMLDAALGIFGPGEVYSNLVYGIQSLRGIPDGRRFDARDETDRCLAATDGMLARGVIPLFTVYHTSGHSKIGELQLDHDELLRFAVGYGERVYASGIVAEDRNSAIFGLGSIANHLYNDAYFLAKTKAMSA